MPYQGIRTLNPDGTYIDMEGNLINPGEGDDDEKCGQCGNHFVLGKENQDMTWIGCENQDCGKWYHSHCVGMNNEQCIEK